LIQRPAEFAASALDGLEGSMDLLSEVLRTVQLNGAIFYNAAFSCPWSFRSPASGALARWIGSNAGHVIVYHLVTTGEAWIRLEEGPPVSLTAGDIVVFPNGDPHLMGNGAPTEPFDNEKDLERILTHGVEPVHRGGGGEITRFVCGYLTCDPQIHTVLLSGLPRLLKVNIRNDPAGSWLENSILFSVAAAQSGHAGSEALLAKLSEALFIETLRQYVVRLPHSETGWMAGARDPDVGKALALLHRTPAHPWTIANLAEEVGVSRSVLAERFRHYLGEPPMSYLARWRRQLGARMLTRTNASVAEIALEAGYDSEAAFNRAFKREFGVPPARFRRQARGARIGEPAHAPADPSRAATSNNSSQNVISQRNQ
jgi:AraC-like DNA-binding protein